jgi:hypothetical protein
MINEILEMAERSLHQLNQPHDNVGLNEGVDRSLVSILGLDEMREIC